MDEQKEKKEYEEPTVEKVEFDFNEVITASQCTCFDYGLHEPSNIFHL